MDFRNRTHEEIRRLGGVGHVNEGVEIVVNGLATRLIAWPGNGFQTQSVHVVTHRPGQRSDPYVHPLAEEAALCLHGRGEVLLHDRWVAVEPGDIAYWPAGVEHATRNARGAEREFVLVAQLTPPPIDLYEPAGLYDRGAGAMRLEVIERARRTATPGRLTVGSELRLNEREPEVRAWNLDPERIRARGALFNLFRGAALGESVVPLTLALWPGHGPRSASINFGPLEPGVHAPRHTHPISDECLIVLGGGPADLELGSERVRLSVGDVLLAPCGVEHGGGPTAEQGRVWIAGFAAPAQHDLLLKSDRFDGRALAAPPYEELRVEGWRAPRA